EIPGEGLVWDLSTFSTDGSIKVSQASALMENKAVTLNLYPNPSNGEVTIELSEVTNCLQLQLVSLSGKVIKEETFSKVDKVNWDLSAYTTGIYLLRLKSDRQSFTERIVLKNEF
ncbi:MAG: T9SS type A sorting domain-containing protein, partial [Bacteroidales bacterium]|nr:T9SS type A sorting domain-containing protein [Bacteroidales bacterium]